MNTKLTLALINRAAPYSIAPGNRDVQIISPTSGFNNSNPWANFPF